MFMRDKIKLSKCNHGVKRVFDLKRRGTAELFVFNKYYREALLWM